MFHSLPCTYLHVHPKLHPKHMYTLIGVSTRYPNKSNPNRNKSFFHLAMSDSTTLVAELLNSIYCRKRCELPRDVFTVDESSQHFSLVMITWYSVLPYVIDRRRLFHTARSVKTQKNKYFFLPVAFTCKDLASTSLPVHKWILTLQNYTWLTHIMKSEKNALHLLASLINTKSHGYPQHQNTALHDKSFLVGL